MSAAKNTRAKSIGHYILGKTIGEGTFGKVKLGTHILTGEKVAVKILEKDRIANVADVERVAREIHILKLVQHPHVVQLYEIIETPRQLYLIMEFCSGGELFDHIVASGRVRERDACRLFHQILAGVEQIHRKGVVHRDLKPENLLLDGTEDMQIIKIADFGLSNTFREGQLLKTACGSPCYAAPEMIAGHKYVPNFCDVWSCGVILFALVCGYLPFEDQNTNNLYRKIMNADYQAPKFISTNARDMIARMLTTDPETRITIPRIRQHAWYRQIAEASIPWDGEREDRRLEDDVLEQLERYGFPRDYAVKCLGMSKHNHVTTTYYLLLEKKRRQAGADSAVAIQNAQSPFSKPLPAARGLPQEIELMAEGLRSRDPSPSPGDVRASATTPGPGARSPQLTFDPARVVGSTEDADRAAGAPPSPAVFCEGASKAPRPNYAQWAQAFDVPTPGRGTTADGFASPALGHRSPGVRQGGDSARRGSAEAADAGQLGYAQGAGQTRRSSGSGAVTPRAPAPPTGLGANGQTPRRPAPHVVPSAATTPRRPPITSPLGDGPGAFRGRTPGRRPGAPGTPSRESASSAMGHHAPMTARDGTPELLSRPGTSQGTPMTARAPGASASSRVAQANEARRRQFGVANGQNGAAQPGSARGPSPPSIARGAQGVHGSSYYTEAVGNSHGMPGIAKPPEVGSRYAGNGGNRASSATPDMASGRNAHARPFEPVGGDVPLSAREVRESPDVMRTCQGAFNVSCTTSKAPKQIMQEIQRALQYQKVVFKQTNAHLVKCQRQNLRFEVEISGLDNLESMYVVRFRRAAGELNTYKELCASLLAEMKI